MTGFRIQSGDKGSWLRSSSAGLVVCLVLVALLAVMLVPHLHETPRDAEHCAICVVMHSVAPVAAAAVRIVLVAVGITAPVLKTRAIARYWHPQLFTRPPPVSSQA